MKKGDGRTDLRHKDRWRQLFQETGVMRACCGFSMPQAAAAGLNQITSLWCYIHPTLLMEWNSKDIWQLANILVPEFEMPQNHLLMHSLKMKVILTHLLQFGGLVAWKHYLQVPLWPTWMNLEQVLIRLKANWWCLLLWRLQAPTFQLLDWSQCTTKKSCSSLTRDCPINKSFPTEVHLCR